MRHFIMEYPGDPPADIYEMTRQEFLERFPRQPIVLSDPSTGEVLESIPMGEDEIHCDLCNVDPGNTIYLCLQGKTARAHCEQCFKEGWLPYCKENE